MLHTERKGKDVKEGSAREHENRIVQGEGISADHLFFNVFVECLKKLILFNLTST